MDESAARQLAAWLDEAADAADRFDGIAQGLRPRIAERDDPAHRLAQAFEYVLRVDTYRPMLVLDDGSTHPPALADVEPGTVGVWENVEPHVRSAAGRARLNDLLFERRVGNGRERVGSAVDAYLDLARNWRPIMAATLLPRALNIAKRVGSADGAKAVEALALELITASLEVEDPKPGLPLNLLEMLVDDGSNDPEVDALLDRCRSVLASVWDATAAIELQRRRAASQAEREELDRDFVVEHLRMAEASEGFLRAHHLEVAASYARDHGLRDLHDEALRARQSMSREDFDLQTVSTSVEIPREHVEAVIEEYLEAADWREALLRFAHLRPPTGNVEDNRRTARETAQEFPLQHLLPTVLLGGDGLPRFQAASEEERSEVQLAKHEQLRLQLWAAWGMEVLHRLADRFGRPEDVEFESWLQERPHVSRGTARSIRRALEHLWDEEYESALAVAIPRIETLCRNLVLIFDQPVYELQRTERTGQYPSLRKLLPVLQRHGLPESWYRYLSTTFVNVTGLNLRNEQAHGFIDDPGPAPAVLAVHAALLLATLPTGPVSHPADAEGVHE